MKCELHQARPDFHGCETIELVLNELQEIAGLAGLIDDAGFRKPQHAEFGFRRMRHLFQFLPCLLCRATGKEGITAHQAQHRLVKMDKEFQ